MTQTFNRRTVLLSGFAATTTLAAPGILHAEFARRNMSSFSMQDWRDHFETLGVATVVADTSSRALHFWSADGSDYGRYPCRHHTHPNTRVQGGGDVGLSLG